MKDLVPIVVNLNAANEKKLDESYLSMFGGALEMMLQRMFGGTELAQDSRYTVRGTASQVAAFGDALAKEKNYMETFMKNGLNNPSSFRSRHELEGAVANFERETGLKWPFT
jgi:hypothetical protein